MMRFEGNEYDGDRRESQRRAYMGPRLVFWKPMQFGEPRCRGWMNDVSASGMSFITNAKIRPRIGEDVEVTHAADGDTTVCKVVRIQFLESTLARIGCQISVADMPGHDCGVPRRFDCVGAS